MSNEMEFEVGHDQRGEEWRDKSNPHPVNEKIIDICLDGYNAANKFLQESRSKKSNP